jgi:glycosyltransferase involved in cell wall biosynthesis
LTAYNRAGQIGSTIQSILAQSMGDFELVISDDCSTDETQEICRAFEVSDRRVRYVRNEENLNMPGNLNGAIRRTTAPLIANLHDGDVYRPDLLARWREALDAQPDAAFVFNAWEMVDDEGRPAGSYTAGFGPRVEQGELVDFAIGSFRPGGPMRPRPPEPGVKTARQRAIYWFLGPFASPVWGTVMGRRTRYEEMGLFDPRFGFISDVAMWLRLNARYPAAYISEPLFALAPRGLDRPHAKLNWRLEKILVEMLEEAIAFSEETFEMPRSALKLSLRRAYVRRWLFLLLWSAGNGNREGVRKGLELFGMDRSRVLRAVARLGVPWTRGTGSRTPA